MRLFKSRPDERPGPLPDGPWSVREGLYQDRVMLLRINAGLEAFVGNRSCSMRAGIAVQCNAPDERGFPSVADSGALGRFEDDFVGLFTDDGSAALAAVITTNGMREFVFYGSDEGRFRRRFSDWAVTPKSHRVQLLIAHDRKWTIYLTLAGAL